MMMVLAIGALLPVELPLRTHQGPWPIQSCMSKGHSNLEKTFQSIIKKSEPVLHGDVFSPLDSFWRVLYVEWMVVVPPACMHLTILHVPSGKAQVSHSRLFLHPSIYLSIHPPMWDSAREVYEYMISELTYYMAQTHASTHHGNVCSKVRRFQVDRIG